MFLFHNATDYLTPVILKKDGPVQLVAIILDSEGRSHCIPPNQRWEVKPQISMDTDAACKPVQMTIPAEKAGAQLIKDGQFYGLVIVPEINTPTGITFDLEAAGKESKRIREQSESALIDQYVKHAKDEQLQNRAMRPPSLSVQRILEARGMDLKRDYGLEPVGYKVSERAAQRDSEMETLRKENAEIKEMLNMLLEDKDKKSKKEKVSA